jgi:hypothetical protein
MWPQKADFHSIFVDFVLRKGPDKSGNLPYFTITPLRNKAIGLINQSDLMNNIAGRLYLVTVKKSLIYQVMICFEVNRVFGWYRR